jgi:hypothetical protein
MSVPGLEMEREIVSLEEDGMQLSSNGYVQRSAAQWREIIARYRQSGLGSRDFCAAEGLVPRTFENWERRLRRKETKQGQFVEIAPSPNVSGPWAVEVEFPNGVRLRVRG